MPWDIFRDNGRYCVHKLNTDGSQGERVACHESEAAAQAQVDALYANEDTAEFTIRRVSEFKGAFPDVPLAGGVDYDQLIAGDDDPFFVTLPVVPEVGATSKNGLVYDDGLVASIEQQILAKKPGGIFGHIAEHDSSAFPDPQVLWVGAMRQNGTLWAKGYVPPGNGREHLRRKKAVGAAVSTSIYGRGQKVTLEQGNHRLAQFELESIDFAPPERAALGHAASIHVTREQAGRQTPEKAKDTTMDKEQVIRELTAEDVAQLPDSVREAIATEAAATAIAEMRQTLGLDEDADLVQTVKELRQAGKQQDAAGERVAELEQRLEHYEVREFNRALDDHVAELTNWRASTAERQARVEALRKQLRQGILYALNGERDPGKIAEVAQEVWDDMQPIVESVRDSLTGPAAVVSGKVRDYRKIDDSPEARRRARAETGI